MRNHLTSLGISLLVAVAGSAAAQPATKQATQGQIIGPELKQATQGQMPASGVAAKQATQGQMPAGSAAAKQATQGQIIGPEMAARQATQGQRSVTEALRNAGQFNTFLSLMDLAGFRDLGGHVDFRDLGLKAGIQDNGLRGVTILAPTDAAFAALDPKALAELQSSPEAARRFVRAHMIDRPLKVTDMFDPVENSSKQFTSSQGWVLGFQCNGRHSGMHNPVINGKARVSAYQDVQVAGAVIHGIDAVLIP